MIVAGASIVGPGAKSEGQKAGFVLFKDIKPPALGDKDEYWRWWQDDFKDYLDATTPGMRACLPP